MSAEHEVRGGADHPDECPHRAHGIDRPATHDIQDQQQTRKRDHRADHCQATGTVPVAYPQPTDDDDGCRVLEEQRDAHRQPRDRLEEAELSPGDRYQAERDDQPGVPT